MENAKARPLAFFFFFLNSTHVYSHTHGYIVSSHSTLLTFISTIISQIPNRHCQCWGCTVAPCAKSRSTLFLVSWVHPNSCIFHLGAADIKDLILFNVAFEWTSVSRDAASVRERLRGWLVFELSVDGIDL